MKINEVSPEYIERYKKEHSKRATAADQAGDFAKGHEHFKKINQLTKQQFQRDSKPEKVDEISNFMTLPTKPVTAEEQWKRQIRLLAKQYQTNAGSLAALGRENGPDSAEAVAYEYLRDPSKIRVPGTAAPASTVNWDEVIRRLPMGLSGMALLQAAEEYLINNKGMLRSTVRSLLNNDENQRTLSAAYAKKNTPAEGMAEDSLNEFAPSSSGDDGDDGFDDETLKRLAAQWWNGDEDPRIEQTLAAAGWEIGQDEGYEDEPGVFVVQAGDVNGNSYISWPADELRQGMVEDFLNEFAPGDRDDGGDLPPEIHTLANRWWNATDDQPMITNVLRSMGWSIAQVESEDDAVQLQYRDGTTYFVSADEFDPDLFEQGISEAEGPGRVDPILYKALARMTKGGYDDAKIALAIEFGLLDMKHNYATANNYIPKLVDLYNQKHGVAEGKPREKEADYGDDYQDMVSRVKKLAGMGPLKTVYDPAKRVYKNVPTAVQPKKEQR